MGGGVEKRKGLFAEPGSTAKMVLTGHAFVVDKIWIGGNLRETRATPLY